jgi:hypothetical protein
MAWHLVYEMVPNHAETKAATTGTGNSTKGRRRVARALALLALTPLIGCRAEIGDPLTEDFSANNNSTGGPGHVKGNGMVDQGVGDNVAGGVGTSPVIVQPTWRLTNIEYANTVHDLLGFTPTVPLDPDGAAGGFSAGLGAGDASVIAYHASAIDIAAKAVSGMASLVPCAATVTGAAATTCASKFIDTFGPKIFRRPVDDGLRTSLNGLYSAVSAQFGFTAGVQSVLEEMLQSPYFLYHLELEERGAGTGKVPVTGYSMASRLSYLIWTSMPDDALFAKAAANQLSSADQIQTEVARMVADPKAKAGLRNFYEQWLRINSMPLSKTGKYGDTYTPAMQTSIRASFDAQVESALWADGGGLTALLTGNKAFVDANTAQLFGMGGVTGTGLQEITMNAQQRVGILMHPAIMATFATDNGTHPIKRGVFVWDQVLCQPLPDPPPNVPTFPGVTPDSSVRQAYETFTSPPLCQGCHARINPVGFLFESFDTVGAYRTSDDNNKPVNSAVTIAGASDDTLNVATPNAVQFASNIAKEGTLASSCLVAQLYRYTIKRMDAGADQDILTSLGTKFKDGGENVKTLLAALTQTEPFLNRMNAP